MDQVADPQQPPQPDPITVQVDGVGPVQFPAGTSQADMEIALKQLSDQYQKTNDPSVWDRLKTAAGQALHDTSPMRMLDKENLPLFAGGVAGGITGGAMAIPVAGATSMLTSAAQGGTPDENKSQAMQSMLAESVGPALKLGKPMGERLMQSAVKPVGDAAWSVFKSIKAGESVPPIVKTLLDEGINVSHTGVARLNALLGQANQAVTGAIDNMTGSVSKNQVIAHTLPTAYKMAKRGPDAIKAFNDVIDKFLDNPVFKGDLSPQELQGMKTEGYKGIDYGEMGSSAVESTKSLLRGMKLELEHLSEAQGGPDLRALNAKVGGYLEALDAVAKRVQVHGNSNPLGLAALTHAKTAFLGALVDRSPAVKSLLARGLYQSASKVSGVAPSVLRGLISSIAESSDDSTPSSPAPSGQ